jgi:thioredoxin-like negative regulator of GroEL
MVYEKMMESAHENEKYHYAARVAAVWQGAGENEKALTWLGQIAEKWPNNPLLRFTLAESYLRSGRFDEARSNFEMAVNAEEKPDKKDELLFKIAKDWVDVGLVEDAKAIYARVAESGRNELVRRRAKVLLVDIDRENANDKAGSPHVR